MRNQAIPPLAGKNFRVQLLQIYTLLLALCVSVNAVQSGNSPIAYPDKIAVIQNIIVLPLGFDCYHLTAGGIREYDDAISREVRKTLSDEVTKQIDTDRFTVTTLPDRHNNLTTIRKYRQFYAVVNSSITSFFTGPGRFPSARKHFNFTLPPASPSILPNAKDALLIINGFDDRSTRRRNNAKVGAAVASVFGIASAALIGIGGVMSMQQDMSYATCALVNRKGEIIWYNTAILTGNKDLSTQKHASQLMLRLLNGIDGKRRPR